ncbi:MAG: Hsp20/alpha crystallin family protein [Bacteroidetes bacterium]|nr:Hsp20/alpha crystallin family protein [Bacteroidota bacterium]
MKIRIKGNTIRLRLSKSEVAFFEKEKQISEETNFGNSTLIYQLVNDVNTGSIKATLQNNCISVHIPSEYSLKWTSSNLVGLSNDMDVGNDKKLFILIEKDFKCLDETIEDQSDNYDNPLAQAK